MNSRSWKRYEQQVAESFGYTRALMKGTKEKSDAAPAEPGEEARWIIDAKLRTDLELWKWMAELVDYSEEKGKPPILVFKVYRKHQSYAIVTRDFFFSNFRLHISNFKMIWWKKFDKMNFQEAFEKATKNAGDNRIPGLLMDQYNEAGHIDYICIKLENLMSLMKAKGMFEKGAEEDE